MSAMNANNPQGAELSAYYSDYYNGSEAESQWRRLGAVDKASNFLQLLGTVASPAERPTILVIGCGQGAVLEELVGRGYSARGVEISRSGAELASDRGLDVRLVDGVNTGFDDNSFDVVLLTHVVEHLENPRETLVEAARVGQWVVVEVPLEYRWRTPRDFVPNAVGHINIYNMKLIRQLLQSMNLDVVAEMVSNPSREVFEFQQGRVKGGLRWLIREGALRTVSPVATGLFTYHGTLLCRKNQGSAA